MYRLSRLSLLRSLLAMAACLLLASGPARTAGAAGDPSDAPARSAPPGAPEAPGAPGARCDVPAALSPPSGRLANTAHAIRPGGHLSILAVGSALVGPHLGADEAFPRRMVAALRHLAPGLTVQLDLRSDRGATAADLVPILRTELDRHPYQLVLWQTGTVDAARKVRPDEFARALNDGLKVARSKGSDVVLIDPQFSRLLEQRADLTPYEERIEQQARTPDTQLFPRFALMRLWVEAGVLDVEKAPAANRRATVIRLHECLAEALARAVTTGAATTASPGASPAASPGASPDGNRGASRGANRGQVSE